MIKPVVFRIDPEKGFHLHKEKCTYALPLDQGGVNVSEEDILKGKYKPMGGKAKSWLPCSHCMLRLSGISSREFYV